MTTIPNDQISLGHTIKIQSRSINIAGKKILFDVKRGLAKA